MKIAVATMLAVLAVALSSGAVAAQSTEGTGSDNMSHVANLQYALLGTQTAQNGSDVEFLKLGPREYAIAGTLRNGMQIVDITDPTRPTIAGVYECPITQGDVQVWRQGERILATYTADSRIAPASSSGARDEARLDTQCVREFKMTGDEIGTFLVDLTDPTQPRGLSFLPVPAGSHNMTVHPGGDYVYNSNSELITSASTRPIVTIFDVSDPTAPKHVQDYVIPFQPVGLGSESHDITFNTTGDRAYVAALSQTLILDTTDPANPTTLTQIIDPAINVHHGSDPVTLTREDGSTRTLLIITDEQAGALQNANCPGGGLHVYDITGDLEQDPEKLGIWYIPHVEPQTSRCTSHVLRMYPDQGLMTIAWYARGARVIDISGLAEFEGSPATVAFGDGVGMTEIGYFYFPDSDAWSFKTNRIAADGSFYGYANDVDRGFDVFHFDGDLQVPPLEPEDLGDDDPAQPTSSPSPTGSLDPSGTPAPTPTVAGSPSASPEHGEEDLATTGAAGVAVVGATLALLGLGLIGRRTARERY